MSDSAIHLSATHPSTHAYVKSLDSVNHGALPQYSKQEECRLAVLAQRGDLRAREKLVRTLLPMVISIVRDYFPPDRVRYAAIDSHDLIQVGNLAVIKVVERFDPSRGIRLSSYAYSAIMFDVRAHAIEHGYRSIRVPRTSQRDRSKSIERYFHAVRESVSLDAFEDCHDARDYDTPDSIVSAAEQTQQEQELAHRLLGSDAIGNRERHVLWYRFFAGETLEKIGDRLGVTRERVRQIESRALRKLRLSAGSSFQGKCETKRTVRVPGVPNAA